MGTAEDATRQAADDGEREYAPGDEPSVDQVPLLIDGRRIMCPRCEKVHDILAYVPMQTIEKYAASTNPIYKCPNCRWIFSPASDLEARVVDLEKHIRHLEAQPA